MYKFNMLLFNRILQFKNNNGVRLCTQAGFSSRTLISWGNYYTKIPVWGIVDICNAARISIASLLDNIEKDCIDDIDYNIRPIPEDQFKPLTFDNEAIGNIYKKGGWCKITKNEFLSKLGVYDGTVNNWIHNQKALRLSVLIDICNTFELNINKFIIDPNRPAVSPTKDGSTHALLAFQQMQTNMKSLQLTNIQQSKMIASMQREIEKLKEERDNFKNTCLLLEKKQASREWSSALAVAEDIAPPYASPPAMRTFSSTGTGISKQNKTRYVFNKYLFKSLPTLSGMSLEALSSLCKISPVYLEEGGDEFRFSQLVNLCNKLHISIRHFFLPEGELYIIAQPEEYFLDANHFGRITFCLDNIASLADVGGVLGLGRAHFCETIGISTTTFSEWIKGKNQSSLSVNGLLRICNAYHISPDMFFEDPNSEIPRSYPISPEDILFTENLMLKKQAKEQQKKINELRKND